MKKIIFFFFVIVSLASFKYAKKSNTYEDNTILSQYETEQGRFNGKYISYYKNGVKKAEGTFHNNYRSGIWTVCDSTGKMLMQRNYENPFVYKQLFPEVPNEPPILLLNKPVYIPKYNKEGFIDYSYLYERDIYYSKRIWRTIEPQYNTLLFKEKRFINLLYKNIINGNITAYGSPEYDDEFKEPIANPVIDTSLTIIGFRIKEDFFFDMRRLISETRVIGICPVAIDKETKKEKMLFWLYYPELRPILAKEMIENEEINTYEDLFFYRFFYGKIYKESNVYDRVIKDYKTTQQEIDKEAEKIDIDIIEAEHNIWIDGLSE